MVQTGSAICNRIRFWHLITGVQIVTAWTASMQLTYGVLASVIRRSDNSFTFCQSAFFPSVSLFLLIACSCKLGLSFKRSFAFSVVYSFSPSHVVFHFQFFLSFFLNVISRFVLHTSLICCAYFTPYSVALYALFINTFFIFSYLGPLSFKQTNLSG